MKSIVPLFVLCAAISHAEPAGATDLVPHFVSPSGESLKIKTTDAEVTSIVITGPSSLIGELALPGKTTPADAIRLFAARIQEEKDGCIKKDRVNELAFYMIALGQNKIYAPEIFQAINAIADPAGRELVSAPILSPKDFKRFSKQVLDADPLMAFDQRRWLCNYFGDYFDKAKGDGVKNVPDYKGPMYGDL